MRKGVASFSGLAAVVIFILGGARPAPAQQPTGQVVRLGEGETLTIGGVINGGPFYNVGPFSSFRQGQNAQILAPPPKHPAPTPGGFVWGAPETRTKLTLNR